MTAKNSVEIEVLLAELEAVKNENAGLQKINDELTAKVASKGEGGRKAEVKAILEQGRISIEDIAKKVGVTTRNVSSVLSYLRKDGICLGKDSKGRLYIEVEEPKVEVVA
jgi:predicted transcriptional regulator